MTKLSQSFFLWQHFGQNEANYDYKGGQVIWYGLGDPQNEGGNKDCQHHDIRPHETLSAQGLIGFFCCRGDKSLRINVTQEWYPYDKCKENKAYDCERNSGNCKPFLKFAF